MAFRCQSCMVAQSPGTKMKKVVIEIRKVKYEPVKEANGNVRFPEGVETVKELNVCPECYTNGHFQLSVVGSKVLE